MRERRKALLGELDRTGEDQLSLTDPNARVMARMTKTIGAMAEREYFEFEDIRSCEAPSITHVPRPIRGLPLERASSPRRSAAWG